MIPQCGPFRFSVTDQSFHRNPRNSSASGGVHYAGSRHVRAAWARDLKLIGTRIGNLDRRLDLAFWGRKNRHSCEFASASWPEVARSKAVHRKSTDKKKSRLIHFCAERKYSRRSGQTYSRQRQHPEIGGPLARPCGTLPHARHNDCFSYACLFCLLFFSTYSCGPSVCLLT